MEHPIPLGFVGGAVAAGLKKSGKADLGIILSDRPAVGAGVFTRNLFAGSNIPVCREALAGKTLRAVVVHAGQANACTGKAGVAVARATVASVAGVVGCEATEVVVGSTGVIGVLPSAEKIHAGVRAVAAAALTPKGVLDVGRAMMTTDLVQKTASARLRIGGKQVTILGMAKGSGMIHPNMGTMLCYVVTDAAIGKAALARALRAGSDASFNCMTVDGDTSTSDMCVAMANGAAGNAAIKAGSVEFEAFRVKLQGVLTTLARAVARDGEGATRLVTIRVRGAATVEQARIAGKAVGGSNLVKTAIFGRDPNWGRIACAIGYSGARFDPAKVAIKLGKATIFRGGQPAKQDRAALSQYLRDNDEIHIEINLDAGDAEATVWTCDFSYDYVKINAEYTT